MLAEAIF